MIRIFSSRAITIRRQPCRLFRMVNREVDDVFHAGRAHRRHGHQRLARFRRGGVIQQEHFLETVEDTPNGSEFLQVAFDRRHSLRELPRSALVAGQHMYVRGALTKLSRHL